MNSDEQITVGRAQYLCDVVAEGYDALAKAFRDLGGIPPERQNIPNVVGVERSEALASCLFFAQETQKLTEELRESIRRKRKKHLKNRFRYVNVEK